jgi:hypothetical protein
MKCNEMKSEIWNDPPLHGTQLTCHRPSACNALAPHLWAPLVDEDATGCRQSAIELEAVRLIALLADSSARPNTGHHPGHHFSSISAAL